MSTYIRKTSSQLGLDSRSDSKLKVFAENSWRVWDDKFKGDPLPSLLGLTAEAGEVSDVWFKAMRNDVEVNKADVISEVGDVLFYLSVIAQENGFTLEDSIASNIKKLADRESRGAIHDKTNRSL
tara:strand:+ start:1963 stop:2337 length:375 start_codon:yes stop_codon:yes gene_type:complete